MQETPGNRYDPWRFLKIGVTLLLGVFFASSLVYYGLGQWYHAEDPKVNWSLMDCVFMVAITLSTIGYGDWLDLKGKMLAELFTILLAFVGIGVPAFLISTVTALIVDDVVGDTFRRKKMQKEISNLTGHTIVCGAGNVGEHCIQELLKLNRKLVVIDSDAQHLKYLQHDLGTFLFIVGNAEQDETLTAAGIKTASHLIASTGNDKDNLFITLSAKVLNPALRVVTEGIDDHVRKKMVIAGAASVISPSAIGGLRMVSELIRPHTTSFLDNMLRGKTSVRFGELTVNPSSEFIGKTLAQIALRDRADVLVVAARQESEESFTYNPKASFILASGCVLVVMGPTIDIDRLRPLFGEPPI